MEKRGLGHRDREPLISSYSFWEEFGSVETAMEGSRQVWCPNTNPGCKRSLLLQNRRLGNICKISQQKNVPSIKQSRFGSLKS